MQEVAKPMMETDTENENADASDLVTAPVSRALHQCCLTALTVMKMMVVAVDGWKKWTRNVAPCSSLHLLIAGLAKIDFFPEMACTKLRYCLSEI